jgi:hypothetical protein
LYLESSWRWQNSGSDRGQRLWPVCHCGDNCLMRLAEVLAHGFHWVLPFFMGQGGQASLLCHELLAASQWLASVFHLSETGFSLIKVPCCHQEWVTGKNLREMRFSGTSGMATCIRRVFGKLQLYHLTTLPDLPWQSNQLSP